MVTQNQATDPAWHEYIEQTAKQQISHVACAAGGSVPWYPVTIKGDRIIMCPVYHKGAARQAGLCALQAACSQAVRNKTAVLIHCHRSFHRGPILAAVCMVSGGKYTKDEAFRYIHKERQIYPGHMMPLESWPKWEQTNKHAPDVVEAHLWVSTQENQAETKKWRPKQCEDPQLTPRTQDAASKGVRMDNLEEATLLVTVAASKASTEEDMHSSASGSDNKKKRLAASQDAARASSSASMKERLASSDEDDSVLPAASAAASPPAHGVPPPDMLPSIGHVIQEKQDSFNPWNVIIDPWTADEATAREPDAASVEDGHDAKMQDAKESGFEDRTELNQRDAWDDVPSPNSQEAGKENVRSQPRGRERHRNGVRGKRTRLHQEAEAEADFGGEEEEHGDTSSEEQSWSDDDEKRRWKCMSTLERIAAMDSQIKKLHLWQQMQQEQSLADENERLQTMRRPSGELQMFMDSFDFENVLSHDANGGNVLHELCRARRDGSDVYDIAIEAVQLVPDTFVSSKPWAGQLLGMTPLHMLCGAKDRNSKQIDLLRALLDKQADMYAQDPNGRTPLLCCAGCGWWAGARLLQTFRSPMMTTDKWGRNFADLAANCNHELMKWWCDQTGRKKTGNKKPHDDFKKRPTVSDSRHERLATFKGQKGYGKWSQKDWQTDQSWGSQGSAS
jgi:hypothetical protein